ncbi:BA14K family protein [Jiella avicenniae]|uniref:Lectin-like protein BA14k n=1 Tax=Jiella avicenniae TaxID=2907202 RepID=A0A9X1P0U6_9HYPH|nr:BA14K family protein [Jiella avicenniae]MCE7027258.1 BA14K family protein [Jiella avicenniae]
MRKLISMTLAAVLALGTLGTTTVGASADPHWRGHHGSHNWNRGHRWNGHRYYRGGRHYRGGRYYRRHHSNGAAIGAGIAGLAIGAIVGGALADNGRPVPVQRVYPTRGYGGGHIARCEARYRSYDRRTDTFLGYDGHRHRCKY